MVPAMNAAPARTDFTWRPITLGQSDIVWTLYRRYCKRFGVKEGAPQGQEWLAIVEQSSGRIAGVIGVTFLPATSALEVTGLYVYPTRRGLAGMHATLEEIARLYDAGYLRVVCCHVLKGNKRMTRAIRAFFNGRGAAPVADLWAMGLEHT